MLIHDGGVSGEVLRLWRAFHAPLVALAVSAAFAVAARLFRAELLAVAAAGAGVAAGWYVVGDPSFAAGPAFLGTRAGAHRLALLAGLVLVLTVVAIRFAARRGFWPPLLLAAVAGGWWLTGGRLSRPAAPEAWLPALVVVLLVLVMGRLILAFPNERLRPVMASCTLAVALHVIGAPWAWTLLALTPGFAALPLLASAGASGVAPLAPAADLAFVASGVMLAVGRLPRGGVAAGDIAALSPILSLWLLPHLPARLRAAGRAAPLAVALVAGGVGVAAAWLWMRLHR